MNGYGELFLVLNKINQDFVESFSHVKDKFVEELRT